MALIHQTDHHELYIQVRQCLVEYEVIFFASSDNAAQRTLASMFGPFNLIRPIDRGRVSRNFYSGAADKPTKIECCTVDDVSPASTLATVLRAQVVPDKGGHALGEYDGRLSRLV